MLKILRESLQFNLVTEQMESVQEARALLSELIDQTAEKRGVNGGFGNTGTTQDEVVAGLRSQVPPVKTIDGEGWGWVPKKWLKEVGVHLFGRVGQAR